MHKEQHLSALNNQTTYHISTFLFAVRQHTAHMIIVRALYLHNEPHQMSLKNTGTWSPSSYSHPYVPRFLTCWTSLKGRSSCLETKSITKVTSHTPVKGSEGGTQQNSRSKNLYELRTPERQTKGISDNRRSNYQYTMTFPTKIHCNFK